MILTPVVLLHWRPPMRVRNTASDMRHAAEMSRLTEQIGVVMQSHLSGFPRLLRVIGLFAREMRILEGSSDPSSNDAEQA